MPRRPDDDVATGGPDVPGRRSLMAGAGFLLAAGATLAVFLTDNPQYLRIAVVAVAWAFVLATFAAGRRGGDRAAAAAREAQLRRAYEHELDLEVAARREYELELENELRRESEQGMREELDALRSELTALADLRDQVAGVAALGSEIAGLAALRDEVARVAAMRDDILALGSLRQELGQLHELRDDMGRLRAELTEQLSSEMLIERIVMRTQASRLPGEPTRTLDAVWNEETPRELTGGWPAVRLDEPRETRHVEQVRVERTDVRPPSEPRPRETHTAAAWTPPAPPTTTFAGPQPSRLGPPPSAAGAPPSPAPARSAPVDPVAAAPSTMSFPLLPQAAHAEPPPPPAPVEPPPPVDPPPSPLDWLVARELLDTPAESPAWQPSPTPPQPTPRRRRGDDVELPPVPEAEARTAERPSPTPRRRIEDRGGYRVAMPEPSASAVAPAAPVVQPPVPAAGPTTSPGSGNRLAEILAENGVSPATGGRRRRRYRDDDDADDVLSRVLGRE
ncbi:hypothetical protein SAMN05660662_2708 [Blastococcus aurantiacus]|uniref:DUF6779 domain-containing protein n=1 Tax=Blastococcus aurantiacus TaxID=1550231 RepID=A0A1G7MGJ4_9ACTN|nr:DUF6779 domain-containing protein [Blastococcus aurantiacus]SDF60932.1 hypothetical protein SAMN05660662_2708 [Blastococcus aurantiacus]